MFRVVNNLLNLDESGNLSIAHDALKDLYALAKNLLPTFWHEGHGPEVFIEFDFSTEGKEAPISLSVTAFQFGFSEEMSGDFISCYSNHYEGSFKIKLTACFNWTYDEFEVTDVDLDLIFVKELDDSSLSFSDVANAALMYEEIGKLYIEADQITREFIENIWDFNLWEQFISYHTWSNPLPKEEYKNQWEIYKFERRFGDRYTQQPEYVSRREWISNAIKRTQLPSAGSRFMINLLDFWLNHVNWSLFESVDPRP